MNKKSVKQTNSKEGASSAKKCERSQGLLMRADHPRNLLSPPRGFTPHWNEFPMSPILWRENTEVREEEITKEDSELVKVEKK